MAKRVRSAISADRCRTMKVPMLMMVYAAMIGQLMVDVAAGLEIDNQLLSTKNDCFERLVLEAMIPFERTFHVADTNSIRECEKLCKAEVDRCQSFALGISPKGNGTCQLSAQRIDVTSGRRPAGTVYDPDFDIYQRQINCGIDEPKIKPVIGLSPAETTFTPTNPTSTLGDVSTTTQFVSTPNGRPLSSVGISSPSPTTSSSPSSTTYSRPTTSDSRPESSNKANLPDRKPNNHSSDYPATPTRYPIEDRYPTTDRHTQTTNRDRYPQNERPRYGTSYTQTTSTGNGLYLNDRTPSTQPQDTFNFYQDLRPTYSYPMLYEKNYPLPNDKFIGTIAYAQNVPTVSSEFYKPSTTYSSTPQFDTQPTGSYGTSSGGGHITTSTTSTYHNQYGSDGSFSSDGYRPTSTATTYYDRDRPPRYNQTGDSFGPQGNGYSTGLATLFLDRPSGYGGSMKPNSASQSNGYGGASTIIRPVHDSNPCFRRVLAGKRISPQWVRRTLTCERVDDCQTECGQEKRFVCEGFNYRLDPTGRGRGVCELIDVPLSQMNLYSSGHPRDENLIYHPDTDYYERDRNTCRPSPCTNCVPSYGGSSGPPSSSGSDYIRPTTYRPSDHYNSKPSVYDEPYSPPSSLRPSPSFGPSTFNDPAPYNGRPSIYESRPPPSYELSRPPSSYDSRPPDYDRYDVSGTGGSIRPSAGSGYGSDLDRFDTFRPVDLPRPVVYEEVILTSGDNRYGPPKDQPPYKDHYNRPDFIPIEQYRPQYRPSSSSHSSDNSYLPNTRPSSDFQSSSSYHRPPSPHQSDRFPSTSSASAGHNLPPSIYLDREPPPGTASKRKPSARPFVPYSIGEDMPWGSYGGSYGGSQYSQYSSNYWGLRNNDIKRKDDQRVNYYEWGSGSGGGGGGGVDGGSQSHLYGDNDVWAYGGHKKFGGGGGGAGSTEMQPYGLPENSWTRRPGQDECSVKSSEGFRLHKGVVRYSYKAPSITECERKCHSEDSFRCVTYSFRYNSLVNENCLLCDRPINLLDYYADLEPDRDYDIYAMSDDPVMCSQPIAPTARQNNAQCFFRAIDTSRFFKSIVRDSLTVRSVGECEMECIKSSKFTCRAFSFRYGPKTADSGVIDNCQLSDWPVRDLITDRHVVPDPSFDIFERASYGHGCEIQPIVDDKHKKLCYLGYGSPAKLLSSAIKKVVSVASELDCKKECIRFRENTPFKCYSFSFGSQASTFNCEMSDLDQTELKPNVHYAHTSDRDFWLFAWNPFDWTCRDKVTSISGGGGGSGERNEIGHRVNQDRRMDVFREQGDSTWTHFTVSGKPCRVGSACEKNIVTGFYSCELDGAEIGAWDYCCKTDHPCGYSHGFEYPWCFVGDKRDQWRKCSDRYFPAKKPSSSSPISNSLAFSASNDQKKVVRPLSANRSGQSPPRPGGLEEVAAARLWPVTYLYSSGPPNATELSNYVDCNKESC